VKVVTVLGTRPEIIRLSQVIARLDPLCEQTLVHTGQNYDPALSDIFFSDLGVRPPDYYLGVRGESFAARVGRIFVECESVLRRIRPDRLLILGDTDSALCGFIAKRLGVPVYHMEAGNRCFDDRVPEEVNRRVIDHCSDVLLPYTERSRANLLREGIEAQRVYVTGNPIFEVLQTHQEVIAASDILGRLGLEAGRYFLLTAHRQENVDVEARLRALIHAAQRIVEEHALPVVCSVHPRTRQRIDAFGIQTHGASLRLYPPFGFFDFVHLEQHARCVLTDSGTVQEECCIFGVPTVTTRDTTERPETLECGSNILSGVEPGVISRCVNLALAGPATWRPPAEYLEAQASHTIASILLGQ
jgi:UDP-N-acetylglucosamine 2-epimerase (non-hydrolysing)